MILTLIREKPMKTLIIVISGLPCTGKTTLGRKIAKEFWLPFISRDDLKELLFNSLGWQDREWSKKLGIASYDLLYYFLKTQVFAGKSLVLESNFMPKFDTNKFLDLQNQYNLNIFQIHCIADPAVLFDRFKNRAESGERHPGHVDRLNYDEFQKTLEEGGYEIINIDSNIFEIDTTDFEKIEYQKLFEEIKSILVQE